MAEREGVLLDTLIFEAISEHPQIGQTISGIKKYIGRSADVGAVRERLTKYVHAGRLVRQRRIGSGNAYFYALPPDEAARAQALLNANRIARDRGADVPLEPQPRRRMACRLAERDSGKSIARYKRRLREYLEMPDWTLQRHHRAAFSA